MEGQWKGKAESMRRCETQRKEGHEGTSRVTGAGSVKDVPCRGPILVSISVLEVV